MGPRANAPTAFTRIRPAIMREHPACDGAGLPPDQRIDALALILTITAATTLTALMAVYAARARSTLNKIRKARS